MFWTRFFYIGRLLILGGLLAVFTPPEWPDFGDERYQIGVRVGGRDFDFVTWWMGAVQVKREAIAADNHNYLTTDQQADIVLTYLDLLQEVRRVERDIERMYVDPAVADPEAASAELQAEVRDRRDVIEQIQPLAEAVLQAQITAVLQDEGFNVAGMGTTFPAVRMHMSPLPAFLVVSERDEIQQVHARPLENGFLAPDRAELERQIYEDLDLSAYVTNIGGLGVYPTMVIETGNINFLVDVIAHEWAHNWFGQLPLGLNYASSNTMRTINESAANIIGREVGAEVIRRYYPEFVPPPPVPQPTPSSADAAVTPEPPAFDFRDEMRVTRVRVDELLADGKVDEAEAFMEERRQEFVAQGYNLRVLNQAYFAFHGAYAEQGGGAAGSDPIGPLVSDIRDESDGLRNFMWRLAFVTSLSDLEEVAHDLDIFLTDIDDIEDDRD